MSVIFFFYCLIKIVISDLSSLALRMAGFKQSVGPGRSTLRVPRVRAVLH